MHWGKCQGIVFEGDNRIHLGILILVQAPEYTKFRTYAVHTCTASSLSLMLNNLARRHVQAVSTNFSKMYRNLLNLEHQQVASHPSSTLAIVQLRVGVSH